MSSQQIPTLFFPQNPHSKKPQNLEDILVC